MSAKGSSNAPKKAVLLIGAGFGALKVAEDLAGSGVPVVWATRSSHFLTLPGGVESFTEWPSDLNFQFRPLYLRVTRNPLVTPMTHARVESIERRGDGFRAVVAQNPAYIDYDLCSGCGRCIEVCPLNDSDHPPLTRTPPYCPSRALELDKRKLSPCRAACPLGVNVQAYMALTSAGRYDEALAVIREDNPLPAICGRVCHHPCEKECRRNDIDESVAICSVKRFLADYEAKEHPPKFKPSEKPRRSERVAIIGSGPAGLTAAHYLAREGFGVTVFEALAEAGGMLRVGINAFRLPRAVLDAEIKAIADEGVELCVNRTVGSADDLLEQGYKAVLICAGAHKDLKLNVPGEDAENVFGAVEFLRKFYTGQSVNPGRRVAVIGGGNSAIDAARAAIRLGAEDVTIYYRRERKDMPAHESEIVSAEEEGIKIEFLTAPTRVIEKNGKVVALELTRMKLGELDASGRGRPEPIAGSEFKRDADSVIAAIGQRPHVVETGLSRKVETDKSARIKVDDGFHSSREGVFAAGDVVTGPATVVGSMAQGRQAAMKIVEHITGEPPSFVPPTEESRGFGDYLVFSDDTPRQWRPEMAQRQPKSRRRDFEEVDLGFTEDQALAEAKRCLQCGSCCECRICETVCEDVRAIDHFRKQIRVEVASPNVIVADDGELPEGFSLNGEGVYYIGDFKKATDLVNVLIAGSAAAGKAMSASSPLRLQPAPTKHKTPKMDDEPRYGVFFCACNGTMAPKGALDRIRETAAGIPGVITSEIIFSACHPRGAEIIADVVGKNRLNRVILASCVCCPLEFQCISCNDQRNRARIHLFNRLGLERSQFETINVKDHLCIGDPSEDEIVERARDFLRSAFIRARFMESLRFGETKIKNRIVVLGGSEVGLSCAMNLDLQGFNVILAHRCRTKDEADFPEIVKRRPLELSRNGGITHVKEAVIEGIVGHMGDFTVITRENGKKTRRKADIVCLTDENLLELAIPEDMFGLKKFYRYNFSFFHTPQMGLYRVMPRTLQRVNAFEAGTALAAQVATAAAEAFLKDHELSPMIDPERCRGCGRCADVCPFHAIKMVPNDHGFFTAEIVRYNCVGCGGCVGRCPVTAMDMPYFSNRLFEEIVSGAPIWER